MKWFVLLQVALAETNGLTKELTGLLPKIPYMAAIPMTQLEESGVVAWGPSETFELVGTLVDPFEAPIMEVLEQIHENYPRVVVQPDEIMITTGHGQMLINNPKWGLAYLAILAWCEVHAPYYYNPELSDQERLDEFIERLPFELGFEMADAVELAIKCGWDLTVDDNYNTEDPYKPESEQQSEITCWLPAVAHCVVFKCNSGPACLHVPEHEGYLRFTATTAHRWKPRDNRWLRVIDALQERLTMSRKTRTLFEHPVGPTFMGYRKHYE